MTETATGVGRTVQSEYKVGTCKWCETKGDVFRDNLLCDTCDDDTVHCGVCKCRVSYEFKCRHVFQDDWCEWHGSGIDGRDESAKLPFHRLLSAMGEDFVRDLKFAIKSRKFHTWMVAPMIGGGGMLSLYGMPNRNGRDWGDKLIDLGESKRAKDFASGYCWLASLYNETTLVANSTTLRWIDEWLWPFTPVAALGKGSASSRSTGEV